MPTSTETKQFSNISATTAAFSLTGGRYGFIVTATFGGGNVALQVLSGDGTTWVNVRRSTGGPYLWRRGRWS